MRFMLLKSQYIDLCQIAHIFTKISIKVLREIERENRKNPTEMLDFAIKYGIIA